MTDFLTILLFVVIVVGIFLFLERDKKNSNASDDDQEAKDIASIKTEITKLLANVLVLEEKLQRDYNCETIIGFRQSYREGGAYYIREPRVEIKRNKEF
jgi:hypothetical protein